MPMQEKFIRYSTSRQNGIRYGRVSNGLITPLSGPPWQGGEPEGEPVALDQAQLRVPVEPSKIICIGLNYASHVEASQSADQIPELPLVFFKPPSSLIGPGETIAHPAASKRVDYEAELALVIGSKVRHLSEEEASSAIFGYTCANDVTARDLQKTDGQWARAKGFDTFCPVGPWIVTALASDDVLVEGIHNDEVRQAGRTSRMIFPVPFIVSFLSSIYTLMPGDLILTGTPAGIAPMKPGDRVEVRIEGIGSLINTVA